MNQDDKTKVAKIDPKPNEKVEEAKKASEAAPAASEDDEHGDDADEEGEGEEDRIAEFKLVEI